LFAASIVYANGLSNPFTPDDGRIIFMNFQPWKSWTAADLFQRSFFASDPSETTYFRPLTLLTFALNHSIAGRNPEGYRAVNIGIHLSVIVLMTLFFSRLVDPWVVTFTALLYALHPVHVQAVSYISSRSDPLYTLLALLCLISWHKGNEAQGGRRLLYRGLTLVAFFLGLFTKETMIVVPALTVAMDLIWNRAGPWRHKIRENLGWYGSFVALFGIHLLFRMWFGFLFLMEGGLEMDLGSRPLIALKLFSLYLGVIFYPVQLSLFRMVEVPRSFFEWEVILGAILLAGMLILAWLLRHAHKEVSFGILWYLISLLPVLNLTVLIAPLMEHWLYLPLIGLTLAFVGGVRILAERVGEVRGAAIGLILAALLLSARTLTRNAEWSDHLKLFSQDVSSYPRNSGAWSWLASTLKSRGMLKEAIHAYKTTLALSPNHAEPWMGLGEALSFLGKDYEAEAALSRAVSMQPRNPNLYYVLGMHRLKVGRNHEAIEVLDKSIQLEPDPKAYHALGSAYLRLGDEKRAQEAFQKALAIYHTKPAFHAEMHVHLGKLYQLEGGLEEARAEWQIALRFEPNHAEALNLLKQHVK
jgi:tetratricopeptide (TPR) repeat protein